MKETYLILGGAGFIGSHLAAALQDVARVKILDNLSTGKRENLEGVNCEFHYGCICDKERLEDLMRGVDYVFHLAAVTGNLCNSEYIEIYEEVNIRGLLNILNFARKNKVKKVCFASSAAVYGDQIVRCWENTETKPKTPYGITKLTGEHYCNLYNNLGLPTVCLRLFNVFGPRGNGVISKFIDKAKRNEDLEVYGDCTRDFVSVHDTVRAIKHLTFGAYTGVYNVGYGNAISIPKLAEKIVELTHSDSAIIQKEQKKEDIQYSNASNEKLIETGFKFQDPLISTLMDLIKTTNYTSSFLEETTRV